jgi:FtsH-binding integral membrane protein
LAAAVGSCLPVAVPAATPCRAREQAGYRDGMRRTAARKTAGSTVAVGLVLDVCCVLLFVTIGRHTHHDGDSLAGIWHTSWPFLAGLAVGLVLARGWRQPLSIVPTGIAAWLGAAVAGMVIRVLAGQGTALAFIGVTLAFLALFVLGWRVAARIVSTRLRAAG